MAAGKLEENRAYNFCVIYSFGYVAMWLVCSRFSIAINARLLHASPPQSNSCAREICRREFIMHFREKLLKQTNKRWDACESAASSWYNTPDDVREWWWCIVFRSHSLVVVSRLCFKPKNSSELWTSLGWRRKFHSIRM